MLHMTMSQLADHYMILKDLTPDKTPKTYSAMAENQHDGTPYTVILKEMDEKRASIYEQLTHIWNPYTADIYEIIEIEKDTNPSSMSYLAVTEYVYAEGSSIEECMSLSRFIKRNGPLTEAAALSICSQLCEGLSQVHQKGIVHRDINPNNIMISRYDPLNPRIKIVDFGGAKTIDTDQLSDTTVVGTLGYQAPESLSSRTTGQADIYSIGCILNYLLTGQEPGLKSYKGNHYIKSMIEKATSLDLSRRYPTVQAFRTDIEHEMKARFPDNVPFIRALPGFRTHTLWKEFVAGMVYLSILPFYLLTNQEYGMLPLLELLTFYLTGSLIIIFNMGNLLRFVPARIRQNSSYMTSFRIFLMMLLLYMPFLIEQIVDVTRRYLFL